MTEYLITQPTAMSAVNDRVPPQTYICHLPLDIVTIYLIRDNDDDNWYKTLCLWPVTLCKSHCLWLVAQYLKNQLRGFQYCIRRITLVSIEG
jgi:hypothetical protein